jgi:hypothetical protein
MQLIEAGYNRLFLEEYAKAAEKFDAATQLDELSLDACCGSLEASIHLGKLEEATNQAMFLEVQLGSVSFTLLGVLSQYLEY